MDVDEFFNMFMDRLEGCIKGSEQEKMIQEHFGGTYANELICKGCPHYSERSEPYLAVNLQVKNKKSIKDSLEALIEGEMLDGDNCYYCEKCDKKVPTLKRTCIKKLPKHLILVLKRFEFDYEVMQKMKVNDYCEFPEEINMEPYTQEGISRREKKQKAEENKEEIDEEEFKPKYPLDLYKYRLSGVLVHSGYAEGGHYYSFIKDREDTEEGDKWYEFNDEMVKEFDKKELESECFGGDEKWSDVMGNSIYLKNSEKHRNAYVLFYERISTEDIPYEDEEENDTEKKETSDHTMKDDNEEFDIKMGSENESSAPSNLPVLTKKQTIKLPNEILQLVMEENRKYWQYRFMFSKEYSDFILELTTLWNTKNMVLLNYDTRNRDYDLYGIDEKAFKEMIKQKDKFYGGNYCSAKNISYYPEKYLLPHESIDLYAKYGGERVDAYEYEIFKLIATFYLTVTQRASMKEIVPESLDLIKAHLNKSQRACKWLITQFSNQELLYEMLLQCPIQDMRKLTVGILYCAMINLYEEEKDELDHYWQYKEGLRESWHKCYLGNFINLVISNIKESRKWTEFNTNFFCLLSKFASLGQEARLYLLKAKVIGRIIAHYQQDASAFQEFFTDYSDVVFEENTNVEIGLPIKLENTKITLWEEMFQRKRDVQVAEANQDYTFLYETLSYLVRSCVFKADQASTYVDDLRYTQLHEHEYASLLFDEKDIMGLLDSCTTKLSGKHLGSVLIHLCHGNNEFDAALRGVLIQGINDKQLEELKAYFPIFKRYLFINDDHTEERINEGVKDYFTVLSNNVKYSSFMARFTSYLLKLAHMNRSVAEVLASCPEDWDWIIDWIKKTPIPNKTNQQFKQHTREIAISQYKMKCFEDIKRGEIENYDEYDSDDDMSTTKFYKGQKLDYQIGSYSWVTAEVISVLDEMIHVQFTQYNQTKLHWFSVDNESIAPHLAIQNRHDTKAIEHNRIEIETQYRRNIQVQEESASAHVMSESERYSQDVAENDSVSD